MPRVVLRRRARARVAGLGWRLNDLWVHRLPDLLHRFNLRDVFCLHLYSGQEDYRPEARGAEHRLQS